MGYRKIKAARIFTGKEFAPDGSVLVTLENGQIEAIVQETVAGEGIETVSGILSPGFINAHCHLELSHMAATIPRGTGMVDFLLAVMQQRNAGQEKIQAAIENAEAFMLNNGIVAVGDICNTTDTLRRKQEKKLTYVNFIECSGFVPASASARYTAAEQVLDQLAVTGKSSIVPHAPYSVSGDLLIQIMQGATGQVITMHNQESQAENEFFLTGQGPFQRLFASIGVDISFFKAPKKSSLQAVWPALESAGKLILVHNTVTSQEDLDAMQHSSKRNNTGQEIYFCLCPNANIYIGNQLPPIPLFLQNQCNIVLGTDSLSSNNQLSILEEIRTLLLAFPEIGLETALGWATLNGAEALGLSEVFGSFEKGKKPGLVQIEDWKATRIL
jgi:cytosine/adenosine deaminase-related metal-dependent hydrolase